jgi:hypothetical protein
LQYTLGQALDAHSRRLKRGPLGALAQRLNFVNTTQKSLCSSRKRLSDLEVIRSMIDLFTGDALLTWGIFAGFGAVMWYLGLLYRHLERRPITALPRWLFRLCGVTDRQIIDYHRFGVQLVELLFICLSAVGLVTTHSQSQRNNLLAVGTFGIMFFVAVVVLPITERLSKRNMLLRKRTIVNKK